MVARSEAHDSGLCAADGRTKRQFANDLLNLTLAGPQVNRYQKVDKDAAEWLPAQNQCWLAARVMDVREKYGLTKGSTRQKRKHWIGYWLGAVRRTWWCSRTAVRHRRQQLLRRRTRQLQNGMTIGTAASLALRLGRTGLPR